MEARPTVLNKPIGIRAEHICNEPTTLRMKQHNSKSSSSSGYTISDASGDNTIFTVDKKSSNWFSTRSLHDASGIRLFDLRADSKATSVWSIVLPDQDDNPVGTMFRRSHGEGDYVGIRFVDDTSGREVTISVRAKFTAKKDDHCLTSKDVCLYHDDTLVVQTKMIKRYMARVPFRDNEWDVHVAQGFDRSLATALAVYFAITLCEKPVMTKSEAVMSLLLPGGLAGAGVAAGMSAGGGGGGAGGGGDGGGGGGGGSC